MSIYTWWPGNLPKEFWDDFARKYSFWGRDGELVIFRDYYPDENARADADAAKATIVAQANAALSANRTFLGKPAPTQAEYGAQIVALTKQMNGVIRLGLAKFDGTD